MANDEEFIVLTMPPISGKHEVVKTLGIVTGVTVRTRGVGGNIIASLQSIGGGEVTAFTSEVEKARYDAIDRMKEKAKSLGANAVVSMDIETSTMGVNGSMIMISATGTAVILKDVSGKK
ncbi:MAG: YbjQ family protein [Candidatus Micrarchaeota archaeon]|nr:YbjQ family protein [Candidatus Micrarchaeota archaeon]